MDYRRRYNLTVDENLFVAKRNIVDNIWKIALIEGLSLGYPETYAIYNGMSVANKTVDEIIAVNNLKHAWQFIFDTVDYPTDFDYICKLNGYVGDGKLFYKAGQLRNVPVSIRGTIWKPDYPDEFKIKESLRNIMSTENPTERCITLMLYCMRAQMFSGGNNSTAILAANHEMIRNGCGIISVPVERQTEFSERLIKFYESNEMSALKQFVYNFCIDGIDLETQRKHDKKQLSLRRKTMTFNRKKFNFPVPKEVENAITELEKAVLSNSSDLDIYLDWFKQCVRSGTGGEDGMTDEQADEVLHYYYNRQYLK